MILQGLGDFDSSIEEASKALALDPDIGPVYTNLAYSYFLKGQMKDATNVVEEVSARGFNPPETGCAARCDCFCSRRCRRDEARSRAGDG